MGSHKELGNLGMEHAGGKMKITQGQFHRKRSTWLGTVVTWIVMCSIMTALAFLFVEALVRQDFIDQAKLAARMDTMLYPDPPTTIPKPQPSDLAQPKVRYFQDASQPKGGK